MKKRLLALLLVVAMLLPVLPTSLASELPQNTESDVLKLWYKEPASDDSANGVIPPNASVGYKTSGWENYALPIGNGYLGAVIFGRTDRERVQLTENSMTNGSRALTNFAETYLYFNHDEEPVSNYYRDLVLDDAIAHVSYDYEGVTYEREYFATYPDKVLAIHLTASKDGESKKALDFVLGPEVPFLSSETSIEAGTKLASDTRTGTVVADAESKTITLSGNMTGYNIDYYGQWKILTDGTVTATRGKEAANRGNDDDTCNDQLAVAGASYATILVAIDTNYELRKDVFREVTDSNKLKNSTVDPTETVPRWLAAAEKKGLNQLREDHLEDYQKYFDRVELDIGGKLSDTKTTDQLLTEYKAGTYDPYLETLYYQYGRYLMIASSREGCLPANIVGIWCQYEATAGNGAYYQDINIQMNYWSVFANNLAELFQPYADYFTASLPAAQNFARYIINTRFPLNYNADGDNGWAVGVCTTPYSIQSSDTIGEHIGYGMVPLMSETFWDYYEFTMNEQLLADYVWPAVAGSADFVLRTLDYDEAQDLYLSMKGGTPEQHVGFQPIGTTWDQSMAYSNSIHVLQAAEILGGSYLSSDIVNKIKKMAGDKTLIEKLDPIQVGYSGQLKEFREETYYGTYGEYAHRHISHLAGLYPGRVVDNSTPAWLDAAHVSLMERGGSQGPTWARTGWALGHRINSWARMGDGETAYGTYQTLLKTRTNNNLWDTHPPFQIDGNFGATAGIAEMLIQSHEGYIAPLPAIPEAWNTGSYRGLAARGNFEVDAAWADGQATGFTIHSKSGGNCSVKYYNLADAVVKDAKGNVVSFTSEGRDRITFATTAGESYTITNIPQYYKPLPVSNLNISCEDTSKAVLTWTDSANAEGYNVYRATDDDAAYTLLASDVPATTYTVNEAMSATSQYTYAVAAVVDGHESRRTTVTIPPTNATETATGYLLPDGTLHIEIEPVEGADAYEVYEKAADGTLTLVKTSKYTTIAIGDAKGKDYAVKTVSGSFTSEATDVSSIQELTGSIDVDNVFLNKTVTDLTEPAIATPDIFPLGQIVDGDASTRWTHTSAGTRTGTVQLLIDLGAVYDLDSEMKIYEYCLDNYRGGTRGDETTIEVSADNIEWKGVFKGKLRDKQNVVESESILKPNTLAIDDPGNVRYVRFTFVNKDTPTTEYNISLYEITGSGTIAALSFGSKLALQAALEQAADIDLSSLEANQKLKLTEAIAAAEITLAQKPLALQTEVAAATEALEAALEALEQAKPNVAEGKSVTTQPDPATDDYLAEYITDGDYETRYIPAGGNTLKATAEIDLDGTFLVSSINLVDYVIDAGDTYVRCDKVKISLYDGSNWNVVVDKTGETAGTYIANYKNLKTYTFDEQTAETVKVEVESTVRKERPNICEIEVFGVPVEELTNVALHKQATTEQPHATTDYLAEYITDGDYESRFLPAAGNTKVTAEIDLYGTFLVSSVNLVDYVSGPGNDNVRCDNVKISLYDGSDWNVVVDKTGETAGTNIANYKNLKTYTFDKQIAEKVKLEVEETRDPIQRPNICEVEVFGVPLTAVTGVTVTPTEKTLNIGKSVTLTAAVEPENAYDQSVTWSSSNQSVATVTQSGKVTAVGRGTATITVTTADGNKTATCTVTVELDVSAIDTQIAAANTAKTGVEVVDGKNADEVDKDTKFVTTSEMTALTDAITAATNAKYTVTTVAEVNKAARILEQAVHAFAAAIKTGTYDENAEAAAAVEALIDAIGEVTLDSKAAIEAARTAYNALTDDQKALVENLSVLTAAEAKIAELQAAADKAAADKAAADAVIAQIAALNVQSLDDKAAVEAARAAYTALTDDQKALVTNVAALEAAEAAIAELQATADKAAADKAAADAVIAQIAALNVQSLDDKATVEAARAAYTALTDDQKALVTNVAALEAAEAAIAELQATADQAAADKTAANAVKDKIDAIGEVTLDSKAAIEAARAAYDALTDDQKELVSNYDTLTAAEDAYEALLDQTTFFTVTFNANGGQSAPAAVEIPAGSALAKPADPIYDDHHAFDGWYTDAACTEVWDFANDVVTGDLTLYAKWIPLYDVAGIVADADGAPVENVGVKLMQGNNIRAKATTGADGKYVITSIPAGIYNLVAEQQDDHRTTTTKIEIEDHDVTVDTVTLPAQNVSSKLEVEKNTPDIVVGGLDEEAVEQAHEDESVHVDVSMNVAQQEDLSDTADEGLTEDEQKQKEAQTAIKTEAEAAASADEEQEYFFLEIRIKKTEEKGQEKFEDILIETNGLVEIIIPFDTDGKYDFKVFRHHEDNSGKTKVHELKTNKNNDGEYFEVKDGFLVIHAKKFSTYAITYVEGVDKTALKAAVAAAVALDPEAYTEETWAVVETALEAAETILNDANASQENVNAAAETLQTAIKALEKKPDEPGMPDWLLQIILGGGSNPKMPFTDVSKADWFYDEVNGAWQAGLIDGMTKTTYEPNGNLTVAQAIKLAAALHQRSEKGKVYLKNGSDVWYSTYVQYAVDNGIIEAKYQNYSVAQMNAAATRAEFVHILHGAYDYYRWINNVADNAIPDVKMGNVYAAEIYEFYRAGILTGSDAAGTFYPNSSIKRSEVAAILIRMFDRDARQSVTLG